MNKQTNYRPVLYYSITFLITFALWFTGAYYSFQEDKESLYSTFLLLGLVTPFIASLFFIFLSKDKSLKRTFFNRLINLKLIQPKMLPVIIFLMPIVVLISVLISTLFGGSLSQLHLAEKFSFSIGAVSALLVLVLASAFEELGWRGYAFDSLQKGNTFLKASLLFSVLWSFWHIPLLFANGSYQFEIFHQNPWYAVSMFVGIIPMGIIISWVCIKNGKSIFAAILFHFIINMSQEAFLMTQNTKAIETGVLVVVAIIIIMMDKKLFFSEPSLNQQARA